VADGNNNLDEYPNEANNSRAVRFYIEPVPFADLVTSDVVAPDQAVHGSSISVNYKVTNKGSATSRGEAAATNSWTDSIWLSVDKTRPSPGKGDILLGSVTHSGNLAVGQDYLGTAQVSIPEGMRSGKYFITVWSDTYDAILEDTLASNINPDDPNQYDNNNYKARAIDILGITPPDLTVTQIQAETAAVAGGSYTFSYTVQNRGDLFEGGWEDSVYITDNPDYNLATERWYVGSYAQRRALSNGQSYSVTQTVTLPPSIRGKYLVVKTDTYYGQYYTTGLIGELSESNNTLSAASTITRSISDLRVSSVLTQPQNFSGEETTISWTVVNQGADVWSGTQGWVDSVYFSPDPVFDYRRATALGAVVHNNTGFASGASYSASLKAKLPPGTEGQYYIYVITDSAHSTDSLSNSPSYNAQQESDKGDSFDGVKRLYGTSVYESTNNTNNMTRGELSITYREPDLQIDDIQLSSAQVGSGQLLTVTWTATNRGTRQTRTNSWLDGIYLSKDASLDKSDYPMVDRGEEVEYKLRVRLTNLGVELDAQGQYKPKYLKPGESYTNSATFEIPQSISGQFKVLVKVDTGLFNDFYPQEASTIRDGLQTIDEYGANQVLEFKDEGNNVASTNLTITLATPPDLRVSTVSTDERVIAGQSFTVNYQVRNHGGDTPSDQGNWSDLVYLSKDRFLDIRSDRFIGYVGHGGGLAASASYDGSLTLTAPRDLEGAYYVFVITDPATVFGAGSFGSVPSSSKCRRLLTSKSPTLLCPSVPMLVMTSRSTLRSATTPSTLPMATGPMPCICPLTTTGIWAMY
jgi:hypothetical protein